MCEIISVAEQNILFELDLTFVISAESRVNSSDPTVPLSPYDTVRLESSLLALCVLLLLETAPSPSDNFETKPIRKDPTSGSINHKVLLSFPVRSDPPSMSTISRCTDTPPYRKFLNWASKVVHSSASRADRSLKKENGCCCLFDNAGSRDFPSIVLFVIVIERS